MVYDPFAQGPFGVREQSGQLVDPDRHRELTFEVWYPEAEARFPLVLFSHTSAGHRSWPTWTQS
jgi:predicted dienelactone hydrolase